MAYPPKKQNQVSGRSLARFCLQIQGKRKCLDAHQQLESTPLRPCSPAQAQRVLLSTKITRAGLLPHTAAVIRIPDHPCRERTSQKTGPYRHGHHHLPTLTISSFLTGRPDDSAPHTRCKVNLEGDRILSPLLLYFSFQRGRRRQWREYYLSCHL
jgi:hypothetical protein